MRKVDLIEAVARATELTRKDSEVIVEEIFENIIQAVNRGEKIELRGFGSF
jgi:integration host factor subunit beta